MSTSSSSTSSFSFSPSSSFSSTFPPLLLLVLVRGNKARTGEQVSCRRLLFSLFCSFILFYCWILFGMTGEESKTARGCGENLWCNFFSSSSPPSKSSLMPTQSRAGYAPSCTNGVGKQKSVSGKTCPNGRHSVDLNFFSFFLLSPVGAAANVSFVAVEYKM